MKAVAADLDQLAASEQVAKHLVKYGQVLVTNYREFSPVTEGRHGKPIHGERTAWSRARRRFGLPPAHPTILRPSVASG